MAFLASMPGTSSDASFWDAAGGSADMEQPQPMRGQETPAEVEARRVERAREQKKAEAMRAAGSVARQRLSERGGPVRPAMFDGKAFLEQNDAKARQMESTYSKLYKPTTGAYWTAQRNGTGPRAKPVQSRPVRHLVPNYASALPKALSLGSPAFGAMDELHGDDPAEGLMVADHGGADALGEAPFDPMEAPDRFFNDFKSRVANLRSETQSRTQPAELPPARPAATSTSLPEPPAAEKPPPKKKPPPPPPDEPPEAESDRVALPDDSTAVYLTGIGGFENDLLADLPSWDAVDDELDAAVDASSVALPSWDQPLHLS